MYKNEPKTKLQNPEFPIGMKSHSDLACRELSILDMVEESNSKTRKPATFDNLTTLEFSKRYNASLNRRQRTNQAAALRLKH
ncbi:hypothetical protein HC752_24180 [Vibrio sp. S9_S30]|nr:hypothetical protein [Vibrio sp. S9_S30]